MNNIGTSLARAREHFVSCQGSPIVLPDGTSHKAMIHHNDHELFRSLRDEGDASEKRPVVLVFGASAWGTIMENMKLKIGGDVSLPQADGTTETVSMERTYEVAAPLHPKFRQGIITELAVVAFPD